MFLSNTNEEGYKQITWKTNRRGSVAYDVRGNVLHHSFPVFVQKEEYDANMKRMGVVKRSEMNKEEFDKLKVGDK